MIELFGRQINDPVDSFGKAQDSSVKAFGMLREVVSSLRNPAYTGSRRCWPCTVLNAGIVAVAAVVAGRRSTVGGLLVAGIGGVLIALRGYVLPYTPQFAPRLVDRLGVDIGHSPPEASESLGEADNPEAVLGALLSAGVLTGEEELHLSEPFAERWLDKMESLREATDSEIAAAAAEAVAGEAESLVSGDRLLVTGSRDVWLTRPVAIAEAAGIETLVEAGLDRETATTAGGPLRMFVPICPDCEGRIIESTVRNCCGGTKGVYDRPDRDVLACADCESILYTFQPLSATE